MAKASCQDSGAIFLGPVLPGRVLVRTAGALVAIAVVAATGLLWQEATVCRPGGS
jgi:hypothetical protein